jgi:hypothetical protein
MKDWKSQAHVKWECKYHVVVLLVQMHFHNASINIRYKMFIRPTPNFYPRILRQVILSQ